MVESISPGFIQIDYHSDFGVHTMRLPTKELNIGAPKSDSTVDTWDAGTINWRDMTDALITEMLPQMPSSVTFDTATLFQQTSPEVTPTFIDSYTLTSMDGSAVSPGWFKAVQHSLLARDTAGNIAKIILLDAGSGNTFDAENDPSAAGFDDLLAEWFAESNGWSSRANFRPAVFIKGYKTLNEKLRREYRMT
jgi:hypothetical protein